MCVSAGKKCSFSGKFSVPFFLVTTVLRFAFLLYYRWLENIKISENADTNSCMNGLTLFLLFLMELQLPPRLHFLTNLGWQLIGRKGHPLGKKTVLNIFGKHLGLIFLVLYLDDKLPAKVILLSAKCAATITIWPLIEQVKRSFCYLSNVFLRKKNGPRQDHQINVLVFSNLISTRKTPTIQ